ncbi:MAG: bile acid:sodium symporter family protein [Leptospiraceae bacterium]|nr:bile acid:sodium symporter family protein [Leptospiraceae bacterium]
MEKNFSFLVTYFPLWISLVSLISLFFPNLLSWFKGDLITYSLGGVMLAMGLTLSIEDFKRLLNYPIPILLGVFLQYSVMPTLGFLLFHYSNLPTPFGVGIALVSCCPGGTASNVLTYLSKADVALSVTMTTISTLVAIFLTPALTTLIIGSKVDVNAIGLFLSTAKVILLPVGLGILINRYLPSFSRSVTPFSSQISVILIILIVASIIGASSKTILEYGIQIGLFVFLLHSLGFLFGYILSKLFKQSEIYSRTISIEVGMQNSGLGVLLAKENFLDPLVAVPSAISSLFHSLIASALAGYWRRKKL